MLMGFSIPCIIGMLLTAAITLVAPVTEAITVLITLFFYKSSERFKEVVEEIGK